MPAWLALILVLVVLGVALYLLKRFVPMDPIIAAVVNVIVVLLMIWLLLALVGLVPPPPGLPRVVW